MREAGCIIRRVEYINHIIIIVIVIIIILIIKIIILSIQVREAGCIIRRVEYMADNENGFQVTTMITNNVNIRSIFVALSLL